MEKAPARVGAPLEERAPPRGPGGGGAMGLPLTVTYGGSLPREGKVLTSWDEACDPWTMNCKTAPKVWEAQCPSCSGTGYAGSSRRRRGHGSGFAALCAACTGVGWLRFVSDRVGPEPLPDGSDSNPNLAIYRADMPVRECSIDPGAAGNATRKK